MSTLVKLLTALIMSLAMSSCQFDFISTGEQGNGNVVTNDRLAGQSFNSIEASEGLDIIVDQNPEFQVSVEADENLQELILTEIRGNTLKIHCKKSIGRATSKKVFVSMPEVARLESNSGADLWSMGVIKASNIHLKTSSGADIEVAVEADEVILETSSGSDIDIKGTAKTVRAHASSGSDINASELIASDASAEASSGADITVNSKDKVDIRTSSGGNVNYRGNPAIVQKQGQPLNNMFKD